MCITTIANLMQNSIKEGNERQYFSRDREIVPYIDSHWEYMTSLPRRVTQSWHSTIHKTLLKERGIEMLLIQKPSHSNSIVFVLFFRFNFCLPGTHS